MTMRYFGVSLLNLIMICAVSKALLRGDTKTTSISLFGPMYLAGSVNLEACSIPSLLRQQSINYLLKCMRFFDSSPVNSSFR